MHYLLKTEPDKYSFDDLLRDGTTVWDGIKNPQALQTLRGMKKGESCILYHSTTGKVAVGLAKVVSVDLAEDGKTPLVTLGAAKPLQHPKSLADMRAAAIFQDSILFRQFRLSVVPLSDAQFAWLVHHDSSPTKP